MEQRVRVIEPGGHGSVLAGLRELWDYRDLLLILIRRDIGVRYKQAVFGFAWAVVQPIALVIVFSLFVNRSDRVVSIDVPYPVFALAGLLSWSFFASGVTSGSESLVGSERLISKVYFPRLAIPAAAVLSWLPDLGLAVLALGAAMAVYTVMPFVGILLLPLVLFVALLAALGVAVWTSALNVAYRDVKHAVPFLVQFWLFATPAVYTDHRFEGAAAAFVALNPMNGVAALTRWSVLGELVVSPVSLAVSMTVLLVLLLSGFRYFHRVERYFADVI